MTEIHYSDLVGGPTAIGGGVARRQVDHGRPAVRPLQAAGGRRVHQLDHRLLQGSVARRGPAPLLPDRLHALAFTGTRPQALRSEPPRNRNTVLFLT